MIYEFKSKIYSFVIDEGINCLYEAQDKGSDECLYDFLLPRAKHELCYSDDEEPFETSSYDDIMEHIKYDTIRCNCFSKLFIKFLKQLKNQF